MPIQTGKTCSSHKCTTVEFNTLFSKQTLFVKLNRMLFTNAQFNVQAATACVVSLKCHVAGILQFCFCSLLGLLEELLGLIT